MHRRAFALAFTFALAAHGAPSLEDAKALIARGALDELYVQLAGVKRGQHPAGDARLAQVLAEGARAAIGRRDPALALGLADKARALDPKNVPACLAAADAALALEQRSVAEEALEQAYAAAPKDWEIAFRLAAFLEQEGAFERARALAQRIPGDAPRGADAAALTLRLKERERAAEDAVAGQRQLEEEAARRRAEAAANAGGGVGRVDVKSVPPVRDAESTMVEVRDGTTMKDRVQGLEARASTNFRIVYSSRGRDFAQRADYEQALLGLFERARHQVQAIVGRATKGPLDVVLYTRDEFQQAFGGAYANAVAGFYSAGKIRMNASEQISDAFFETAAHEYTHAVIDEAAGDGRVSRWFNEGFAEWAGRRAARSALPNGWERREFPRAWQAGGVLPLRAYDEDAIVGRGAASQLAYAKAACALDVLVASGGGTPAVLRVLAALGRGERFYDAFAGQYGKSRMDTLDAAAEKRCGE